MRATQTKFWEILSFLLPRKLVYLSGVALLEHAVTGKYEDTEVESLSFIEALGRYSDGFEI